VANQLFDSGREGFLDGSIDYDTAVVKAVLLRSYTFSAAHKFLSDITGSGATVVATSPALTSKTVTAGVAGAADTTFSAVPLGAACTAIVLVQSSAVTGGADVAAAAQRVIAYVDTVAGPAALTVTPNGGDVNVAWDTGANKIFKL
jgi:hypothetical protein